MNSDKPHQMLRDPALERAISQAGGPAALARHITANHVKPITAQAICDWKRCPPGRVLVVESAPGVQVTRHELRPDVYPVETVAAG